jgi:type IV pilus assembly protein PilE
MMQCASRPSRSDRRDLNPAHELPVVKMLNVGRRKAGAIATGFTLIELMITVAIIAILVAIALPNYIQYVIRGSRQAAQSELLELSAIQEKIFLNSNAYSPNMASAYTGLATGGLGKSSGQSADRRYFLSVSVDGVTYILTATPDPSKGQAGDGNLTLNSEGVRTWRNGGW